MPIEYQHKLNGPFLRDLTFGDTIGAEAVRYFSQTEMSAEERLLTVAQFAARLAVSRSWEMAERAARDAAATYESVPTIALNEHEREILEAQITACASIVEAIVLRVPYDAVVPPMELPNG